MNFKEIIISVSVGAVLAFVGYRIFNIYLKRKKYSHIPGPPADGLFGFIFGNLFEMIKMTRKSGNFADTLNKW